MAYYYPPNLPADLNIGFETFQKLNDSADEHLDALLDTIVALERDTEKKCETDIITWRGMMTKVRFVIDIILQLIEINCSAVQIMTAPFDMMNGYVDSSVVSFFADTVLLHIYSFEMNATCFQVRNTRSPDLSLKSF